MIDCFYQSALTRVHYSEGGFWSREVKTLLKAQQRLKPNLKCPIQIYSWYDTGAKTCKLQNLRSRFCEPDKASKKNQNQTKIRRIKPKPDKTRKKNSNWAGSRELGSVVAGRSAKEEFKHEAKTIYTSFTFHWIVPPHKIKAKLKGLLEYSKSTKRLSQGGGRLLKKAGPFFRRPESQVLWVFGEKSM